MEKQLTKDQERLLQLLDTSSYDELSDKEKSFVDTQLSREAYEMQRHIRLGSREVYSVPAARPLIISEKKNGIMIPLYQAISAVAAALVISFFVFRTGEIVVKADEKPVYLASDTIYVEKTKVDTVVKYQYVPAGDPNKHTPVVRSTSSDAPLPGAPLLPSISSLNLQNKGQSAAEDETLALVGKIEI